ncbi:beta strand repeat-containing protein [Terriglobus sp. 2YAB30_2]|uniref:beta strand repeat-containing protein n=2 Tax=unclassified Terriglobus TaxID=2628988 RepID=UPI003F971F28
MLEFYPGADDSTQFAGVRRYTATNTFTATATNVIVSPGGTHQVRAHYAGDANYGAAISTTQAITGSTSQATLSLAISPNPSTYGARADMTVTVTPCTVGSYSCDSNWVDIYDGSTAVTSGYPSGGVAHVIWRNFSQGTHVITARIRGNTNLSSATSNAVTLTVGPPLGIVSTLTLADPQQVGSTYTLSAQLTTPAQEIAPTGSVSFVDLTANNSSLATARFGPPTPVLQPTKYTSMTHLPGALYAADFDNDGKADLIYPVYPVGGNSIAFLHGNGDGTFSGTPTADGFSLSFAVADFDHDGKLDVVLTGTSGLSLLRGNGDGTFATATTIASGDTSYSSIFVGDFNGDGKQDIYNRETLFLGNGDGTFQRVIATGVSGQLAADFNHDGRTDLFAYGTLYLGQSDGTFTAIPAPTYYTALIADFNHDGNPDLFTGDAVVLGNGDGTFQAPIAVDLSDPYGYSNGIYFTGDFNGDGKADLGMATAYAGGYHVPGYYFVSVTFGDGTGAFGNKTSTRGFSNQDFELPAIPTYLPDFNGDTTSDIPVYTQAYIGPPLSIAITLYTAPTVYTANATGITVNGPPYGYHSIQATYPGDTNYLDETSNTATIIAPIPVTVTLAVNRNPINTGQQVTFTATLSPFNEGNQTAGGTINFSEGSTILGTGTLNNGVAQFTTSSLSAGSHSIVAQFPGSGFFGQASSTPLSMQVGPTAVNIIWPPPAAITYGTALSSTQLNASTAIAGSFAYSPVAGTVLAPGTQTLSATFTPTDTVTYSTTTATTTLVVNKATPSISVTQTSPTTPGTNVGTATTLLATLAAGYGTPTGTVTFYDGATSIGAGTLSGNTVSITTTFTTAGTHTITAGYSGNTNFNTVTSAGFSEVVSKLTPTITWPTPAAITYGAALSATQLNATSSIAGAFVYSPAAGVVLAGGSQTLSVTFIPTDTTTYSNATATVTLVVNKATPSITWAAPAAVSYGTALSATQLNATSAVAGTFAYTPAAGAVLGVGPQTLSVTFTPTDTTNYNSITATTTLTVNKATPSITWSTPAPITYGTALSATQLNATSGVAGTFVYSPGPGTVLAPGTQTLSVTFTPTDATSYNSATATTTLVVNKATPTITWAAPSAITYGTALSATQLNATGSVAGTFAYAPASGTVLGAGSQTLATIFTPADTANYSSANGSTTLVVNKATPSITVTQTSPITIGVGTGVATTFRAALAASYGTPTGTVGFYEGTTLLGSVPLISGAASVTTTFSTTGVHTITALYTGDTNFSSVTSASFNETVVLFGIGLAANPTTLTIKQGQSGTATITATPTGNYIGTLTFSCGNLPSSVSCSFAPATLTFNGDNQPQSTTITVSTRTSSAALMTSSSLRLASLFAMPLLAFGLRRRRMLQRGLLVLFAAMLLLPVSGCGGSPTITSSAPTGQQTVTINAQTTANGGSTQSFNFSIVIEP